MRESVVRTMARMRVSLDDVPEAERHADWRIANGLVKEAAQYHMLGHNRHAREMLNAATPYWLEATLRRE